MSGKKSDYENLGEYDMPPEMEAKVNRMIAQADEEDELARINFRWTREAVAVVKQAAGLMGIPYQTFIKQAVFEHSLKVIRETEEAKAARKDQ
jgi:predicted DNA binding CopG/RHH family protein